MRDAESLQIEASSSDLSPHTQPQQPEHCQYGVDALSSSGIDSPRKARISFDTHLHRDAEAGASLREIETSCPPESKHNDHLCESRLSSLPARWLCPGGRWCDEPASESCSGLYRDARALDSSSRRQLWVTGLVSFLKRRSASHITIPLALEWASRTLPYSLTVGSAVDLGSMFCSYPVLRVPNADSTVGLLPHPPAGRPYLYTEEEIQSTAGGALQLGGCRVTY